MSCDGRVCCTTQETCTTYGLGYTLGAKRPANVARFRGLTASQRCRSKRSRCVTPPKSGITSKNGRKEATFHTHRELMALTHSTVLLFRVRRAAARLRRQSSGRHPAPSPCAFLLVTSLDLAHTQGSSPLERREDGWRGLGRAKAPFRASASIWRNCRPKRSATTIRRNCCCCNVY